ncbi:MAG: sigma-70 family RNA polymerase sigma factor, partial [Thermoanaerobaculia bacterium]|nr:sigma-70 family RNA polymerase sigma factor [Thermoanaerobaculia bacterium]
MDDVGEITRLLVELDQERGPGQRAVLERLMPLVYRELKRLAHSHRYRWSSEPSPGTTSLVHEAYLRLAGQTGSGFVNRRQFYALASRAMRSILIDNARWQHRLKRGGGAAPAGEVSHLASAERSEEILALDDALGRLEEREPRLARIVECRCFGGLTVDETAEALAISPATVKRGWSLARTWLSPIRRARPAARGRA